MPNEAIQSCIEAYKARADAETRWLDALGNFATRRAEALHSEAHAAIDREKQRMLATLAEHYRMDLAAIRRQAWLAAKAHSLDVRRLTELAQLLAGRALSFETRISGWCALRVVLARHAAAVADILAEHGERLEAIWNEALPLGSSEWQLVAQLVERFAAAESQRTAELKKHMGDLAAGVYARMKPSEILAACAAH